jgi:glutaredoxin-like protein NrdH
LREKERNMAINYTKVEGEKKDHAVTFYGLSTCGWCKKARNFLDENAIEYEYVYVDLLEGDELKECMEEVVKVNPRKSFPTLIVDDDQVIVGFSEDKFKESLL